LNWSDHCQKVVQKTSVSLNRLRRAMHGCTDYAKSLAYKGLVWSMAPLCGPKNMKLLESVQRRTARWIKSKYDSTLYQWSKSTDDCLTELKWPTLAHRLYQSVVMLHSIMNNYTPINFCHYFTFNTNATRSHPLTLQTRSSMVNAFRYSFFVNSLFVWNSIPYEILSASQFF